MTPEEKLLRAIFGEKASDVRDTSLRLPPGVSGTIVDVRVFNRHGIDKDERAMAIEREEIERLKKDSDDERTILNRATWSRLREMLLGQTATAVPKGAQEGRDDRHGPARQRRPPRMVEVRGRRRQGPVRTSKRSRSSMTTPPS